MTEERFLEEIGKLGIHLSESQMQNLKEYANYLLEYNQHTNLTAIKTIEEVYLKHFYDSLTLVKAVSFENQNILDIGSGAGFPGLVLAIVYPNIKVTLLDSNNKKITFLNHIIEKLTLKNVKALAMRAEEYGKIHREEFDVVTSRAVAALRILLELSFPLLKVKGIFLAMKANAEKEIVEAADTLKVFDGRILNQISFKLPEEKSNRTLILFQKEKITPKEYPRDYAKIIKKPLKKTNN